MFPIDLSVSEAKVEGGRFFVGTSGYSDPIQYNLRVVDDPFGRVGLVEHVVGRGADASDGVRGVYLAGARSNWRDIKSFVTYSPSAATTATSMPIRGRAAAPCF